SIVRKLDEGDNLFASLLNDPETGRNMREAVARTPELISSATRVSDEPGDFMAGVNRGEGTLGKIVKNDVLFDDTLNAVNTLRAGFEDIPEQAPITTCASLLFQVLQ